MDDVGSYRIAVGGLAFGLVAFLIGAAGVLAARGRVPVEYWNVGSAVSGALLGILAPAPSTPKQSEAAAETVAGKHRQAAADATSSADGATTDGAKQAFRAAADAHTSAAEASLRMATSFDKYVGLVPMGLLTIVFVISVLKAGSTPLQSLAAASGAALVGLIVPSPRKGSSQGT